jgi:hypothetical protein
MRELGAALPAPPSPEASRCDMLEALWREAGLIDVELHEFTVQRTFASFDEFWAIVVGWAAVGETIATMSPEAIAQLTARLRVSLPAAADGSISVSARANAVRGRVPRAG